MTRSKTSDTIKPAQPQCLLDRDLVNADTLPMMKDIGLSIFASACSKNRGAFVLHPPDGQTYGCLQFPDDILDLVGIEVNPDSINPNTSMPIFQVTTVENLKKHYTDGNLTAADTVDLLDFLVDNTYQSTPNVGMEPYACDVSGLVTLKCLANAVDKEKPPIRAVTMAGVFTPALWATNQKELSHSEASKFYSSKDFRKMKKLGLNTVQIPVPVKMFVKAHVGDKWMKLLDDYVDQIYAEGLDIIIVLEQGTSPPEELAAPVETAVKLVAKYNHSKDRHAIVALVLPTLDKALLEAAAKASHHVNTWIPTKGGDFTRLSDYPLATGAALDLSHTATVADIASSSSQEDRAKLFYHENMACIARAPLEYSSCFQDMPVTVTQGFDLAIDNCHLKGISDDFYDYGQCGRFNETIDSPWWKDHRYSFAARQLYAYERGHGWSFAAWKLWDTDRDNLGVLDDPAKLLAFEEVEAAGLMPSLLDMDEPIQYPLGNSSSPVGLACLNPPEDDFAMGDATFAPTPAPPPDCGNGWWNFDAEKCDYWIPPTPAPTAPCPVCSNKTVECDPILGMPFSTAIHNDDKPEPSHKALVAESFFSGAVLSLVVSFIIFKVVGNRRQGYEEVPNSAV